LKKAIVNNSRVSVGNTYSKNNYNRSSIEVSNATRRLARLGGKSQNAIVKRTLQTTDFNNNANNSKLLRAIKAEENKEVRKRYGNNNYQKYLRLPENEKERMRDEVMGY
jgi:hypothetical protein